MDSNGKPRAELQQVLSSTSTWLDWLHIAFARIAEAVAARRELRAAQAANDEQRENEALEREFRSSLQAATAAVFAIDGFYRLVQPHVQIDAQEIERRRKNRTARAVWVADAVRRLARIPGKTYASLRQNLITSYKARDLAVHPESAPREFAVHKGLNQLVPYYVATFSLESANGIISTCVEAIMWVADRHRATEGPVVELATPASQLLHELVDSRITFTPGSGLAPKQVSVDGEGDKPTAEGA
jgi:hypothetical protein